MLACTPSTMHACIGARCALLSRCKHPSNSTQCHPYLACRLAGKAAPALDLAWRGMAWWRCSAVSAGRACPTASSDVAHALPASRRAAPACTTTAALARALGAVRARVQGLLPPSARSASLPLRRRVGMPAGLAQLRWPPWPALACAPGPHLLHGHSPLRAIPLPCAWAPCAH